MIRVSAAASHLQAVREGDALPDLGPALKAVCREHFRRIDRFIQLSLLGSAHCVVGHKLAPDCGIYLGSGFGPIASNVATQEEMFREAELPRPYNFVNTLGISAGFHVAKNLRLTGQNLFISRRGASLEAALAAAFADLELGVVSQALVGVVEEVTLPLDQHRLRRDLAADTLVAEGSHWLLLEKGAGTGKTLQMLHFKELTELDVWLKAHYSAGDRTYRTLDEGVSAIGARLQQPFTTGGLDRGTHDNQQAAWAAEFLASGAPGSLFLIGVGPGQGYSLLHLGA